MMLSILKSFGYTKNYDTNSGVNILVVCSRRKDILLTLLLSFFTLQGACGTAGFELTINETGFEDVSGTFTSCSEYEGSKKTTLTTKSVAGDDDYSVNDSENFKDANGTSDIKTAIFNKDRAAINITFKNTTGFPAIVDFYILHTTPTTKYTHEVSSNYYSENDEPLNISQYSDDTRIIISTTETVSDETRKCYLVASFIGISYTRIGQKFEIKSTSDMPSNLSYAYDCVSTNVIHGGFASNPLQPRSVPIADQIKKKIPYRCLASSPYRYYMAIQLASVLANEDETHETMKLDDLYEHLAQSSCFTNGHLAEESSCLTKKRTMEKEIRSIYRNLNTGLKVTWLNRNKGSDE